jgi:hypothetical protein
VKYVFRGHGWLVDSVAFLDQDRIVVTGGEDGTARLLEVASGRELATIVTFRDGVNWLIATPGGYFDSTATAAEKIFWRIGETNDLVPLSRFYTDFYRPGLLTELLQGKRHVPEIDVATSIGIPSLRTMLASNAGLAHIEHRQNRMLMCLSVPPGASIGVDIADEELLNQRQELKVVPDDPTCKNQIDLGGLSEAQLKSVERLANGPRQPFRPPWDNTYSDVSNSQLHVVVVAVSDYPKSSGFDPISFPVPSANILLDYFKNRASDGKPFKGIEIWPPLIDTVATTERIRRTLHDVATQTRSDDVIVIYLAGHGQTSFRDEMFYFASADSVAERLSSTGLSTAALADALREMNAC